jgi:hypothetical protein
MGIDTRFAAKDAATVAVPDEVAGGRRGIVNRDRPVDPSAADHRRRAAHGTARRGHE